MLEQDGTIGMLLRPEETQLRVLASRLRRIVPNAVTLVALVCGMTAIELSMFGRYHEAATALVIAAVFDGLDGRAARLLNSASIFGAELDSLVDFVSFGVAPAVVIFHWSLHAFAGVGWALAVFYAACCGLRLARFNAQLHDRSPSDALTFFVGVPAPAGAALALFPLFAFLASGEDTFASPIFAAIVITASALLMVSRVPTWSLKRFHLGDHLILLLVGMAVIAVLLAAAPWWSFTAGVALYAASIPSGLVARRRALRASRKPEGAQEQRDRPD